MQHLNDKSLTDIQKKLLEYFLALDISSVDKSLKLNIAGAYFFLSNSTRESKKRSIQKIHDKSRKGLYESTCMEKV